MILISLLVALGLEFYLKAGSEYRRFHWFAKMNDYLRDIFSPQAFFDSWVGIAILLLTPLVLIFAFVNLFNGLLYWFVLLLFSAAVLFLSLGPKPLEELLEHYFSSMQRGDLEGAYLHLQQDKNLAREIIASNESELPENDELIRSATRQILTASHHRYFAVITWFILLGPLSALFYRLALVYRDHCAEQDRADQSSAEQDSAEHRPNYSKHLALMDQLIHWIDWLPSRITALLFLLAGDFVSGFYKIKDYLSDFEADNQQLVSDTGLAALSLEMETDGDIKENHQSVALVHRTIILYLVIAALISTIT